MKIIKYFILLLALLSPPILYADFTENNMFVVNQPSSGSAGYDFILEFSPQGQNLNTLISTDEHILGMSDVAFDPVSGHLFYTVSVWDDQIFEIREIDDSGNLINTYTHTDFGSGNIAIVFHQRGDLYIINNGFAFKIESGSTIVNKLFQVPEAVGDLEIDRNGNLFLSDPFVDDIVYKIAPDGTVTPFVDRSDGLSSPYGMAIDHEDNLYVISSSYHNGNTESKIIKFDPAGNPHIFSDDNNLLYPGILDMAFNATGDLFVSCRGNSTIIKFDKMGNGTIFANAADGLNDPKSIEFITYPVPCQVDSDADGDTDGSDLATLVSNVDPDCIHSFAYAFGS